MSKYQIDLGDKIVEASQYQEAIFENIEKGVGNMLINASAGSAKTTTLVKCIDVIPPKKKTLFVAFNKAIVNEIKIKIGNRKDCVITTFHSLGYSILRENLRFLTDSNDGYALNEFKYKTYIKENIDQLCINGETKTLGKKRIQYLRNIEDLCDFSRSNLAFTTKEIKRIADKYGIELIRDEVFVCNKVLLWGKEHIGEIDYSDMVWLPCVLSLKTKKNKFDFILVDEAQDTTIAQSKLVEICTKRGTRVAMCGDQYQMINVWCGADEEAIETFARKSQAKEFNLPISYRCPKKVVELAREYSPNIMAKEDAIEGEVNYDVSIDAPKSGDMVLCRTTAPLVALHLHYLKINKPSFLKGSEEIGKTYLKYIKYTMSNTIDKNMLSQNGMFSELYKILIGRVENARRVYKLVDGDEYTHEAVLELYDVIQGLSALSYGLTTTDELVERIRTIFNGEESENSIQLSTIHKAKGLESDNVYILLPSLMPLKKAKKDWEIKTENNLIYVAITRPKKTLNYITESKSAKSVVANCYDLNDIRKDVERAAEILKYAKKGEITPVVSHGLNELRRLPEKSGMTMPFINNPQTKKKKAASKFAKMIYK